MVLGVSCRTVCEVLSNGAILRMEMEMQVMMGDHGGTPGRAETKREPKPSFTLYSHQSNLPTGRSFHLYTQTVLSFCTQRSTISWLSQTHTDAQLKHPAVHRLASFSES